MICDSIESTKLIIDSLENVVFSHALDIPVTNLSLLNNYLLPSFLRTEIGIVSTLSYVVNLKLQFKHSLLLLTLFPVSADLDSKTLLSVFWQVGHCI